LKSCGCVRRGTSFPSPSVANEPTKQAATDDSSYPRPPRRRWGACLPSLPSLSSLPLSLSPSHPLTLPLSLSPVHRIDFAARASRQRACLRAAAWAAEPRPRPRVCGLVCVRADAHALGSARWARARVRTASASARIQAEVEYKSNKTPKTSILADLTLDFSLRFQTGPTAAGATSFPSPSVTNEHGSRVMSAKPAPTTFLPPVITYRSSTLPPSTAAATAGTASRCAASKTSATALAPSQPALLYPRRRRRPGVAELLARLEAEQVQH
jgi:hypothetical protein